MVHIRTLGGLSIWLDDIALHFDAHSAEALLVYLACQGRPVGREALAEFLWPERTIQQARANLRVALYRLRQQLEPYLLVTRQHIALAPTTPMPVDSLAFEAHLATGQLAEATLLYQGDFLDGFYLDGSAAFEQWALLEREPLRTLAIAAYQQLIGQMVADGQRDAPIAAAQRLLQLDPLHEPTHRQLMRLFAQIGQRSAALTQYAICCQVLDTELGVPPDETTTSLSEQIRFNTFDAIARSDNGTIDPSALQPVFRSLPGGHYRRDLATSFPQHNLPPQPTPFIGREAELAQIDVLLANPDCRLVSLLGVGGMGKTRLAIEAASRQLDIFVDGVLFVSLASVAAPDALVTAIAQQLNIPLGGKDLVAQVMHFVSQRHLLLVLDNFEHLVEASDLIVTLLRHAPRLKVLVTTRTRLQLVEEWLLPVDGFPASDTILGAAAQLFLRSAQRVRPTFTAVGQGNSITTICRQVGGMPLAIELAASWVRVMPCAEIARQLAQRFDMLSTSVRNIPERHRSIRALFDQSWSLLAPPEQQVLMRLSVFQGGFTLDEAVPITGATFDLLLALVDQSLVRSTGATRYDLHELVRQYAAEQLAASGEMETIRQRHFRAYLALARTADSQLRGPAAIAWFDRLEVEQGNLREALRWASDNRRYQDVAWLSVAHSNFWTRRDRWSEALTWLERTLAHAHAWPIDLRLVILTDLYSYWLAGGRYRDVDRHTSELTRLVWTCTSKPLQAAALFMMGLSAPDAAQAARLLADAITLLRQSEGSDNIAAEFCIFSDTNYLLANLLFRYGSLLRNQGDYSQAMALYQESLALFRARGERDAIAYPLGNLGRLALMQGDVRVALQSSNQSCSRCCLTEAWS
jgi:predicted ATPase/DNA-binding SARP family transcriptional activator